MNSELKKRIWKERLLSLGFASPFLAFLIPSIYGGFKNFPEPRAIAFTILELIFVAAYVVVWLVNDSAPVQQRITRNYVISVGFLWVLATVLLVFRDYDTMFNIVYLAPTLIFLTPRKHLTVAVTSFVIYAGAVIAGIYFFSDAKPATAIAASLVTTLTLVVVALSRAQLEREREAEIERIRAKNLSVEEERNRMASDLHDVLGQTLTAINTMSQLSAKLLERGKTEEARETQEQIARLSREALKQMRAVVHSRQTLAIPEEIDRAYQLLTAANVSVSTSVEDVEFPEHVEDAAAHVIREGAANVVHHATANHCRITVSKHGVRVTDDGRVFARGEEGRKGTGIENLKSRVEGIGTVFAGPLPSGDGWVLELVLDQAVGEAAGDRQGLPAKIVRN
ncbi:MAG: histidine kinase [Actinomycetaceae bacterium]|nr:histidine kinase [Actinomycetaceae bacterium]